MTERLSADCVVIGAGAVGLAVARALALRGREVLVLEAEKQFGTGLSSRNSEVIHAGIYYPVGSLKSRLCVEGRAALIAYLGARGLGHRLCGKLIVATRPADIAPLERLQAIGTAAGVERLSLLSGAEAVRLEPALACQAALVSPGTGILDSHAFMLALLGDLEDRGGALVREARVLGGECGASGLRLRVGAPHECTIDARIVVNSGGLAAPAIARGLAGLDPSHVPAMRFAKGCYVAVSGRAPFSRLIYPAPVEGGLGIHVTFDLGGQARLGPDVTWTDDPGDITIPDDAPRRFHDAARGYWPGLALAALRPDYAGVRPKLSGPGEPAADFRIDGPERHGIDGLVNLFGIESPGLTAALAIGEAVCARLSLARLGA